MQKTHTSSVRHTLPLERHLPKRFDQALEKYLVIKILDR